jgi:hypothetical protein
MKKFITSICFILILPIIFLITLSIHWDPFKVFFSYEDFYTNNPITSNREDICFKLLQKNPNKISNFIIGNSRSQAYNTRYWCEKIQQPNNTCFHYDGSSLGLFRVSNAIKYLSKKHKIKNVLLIVDSKSFLETTNPNGHLFIQPPSLSNESKFSYYLTFLKASIDFKFMFFNIVYKITGKYHDYMGGHIRKSKNSYKSNNSTGDILWYALDQAIKSDSISYYSNLKSKGIFYNRKNKDVSKPLIYLAQINLLNEINNIVKKNNINLKIVISPLYNQLAFNEKDKIILTNLFGNENVFDFSGKNKYTDNYTNYYESSHYKPYVANQIMDSIYFTYSKANNNHLGSN